MLPELVMGLVVEALDGGVLDRAVHPLDLTVGPGMTRFGQSMFDVEVGTGRFERMAPERHPLCPHRANVFRRPPVTRGLREVGAVVRQHDADFVGHGSGKGPEEVASDAPGDLVVELDEGELRRAVDGDQEIELALFGSDLGDVEVEEANRVALEPGALGLVAAGVGQARYAVPLEAAMEG